MKTYALKAKDVGQTWHVVDAAGRPLGRVASEVAALLRGKHRPTFQPSMSNGDHVIVVNAAKVVVTGDTLAMHIALALRRRTVVLFGPTSAPEIELYDLGEKVIPEMSCLGCYKTSCDFSPNCMDLISVDMVATAVVRQLRGAPRGSRS